MEEGKGENGGQEEEEGKRQKPGREEEGGVE